MKDFSKPRKNRKRTLGFLRGQVWIAPDFNAPMELVEDGEGMALVSASPNDSKKRSKVRKPIRNNKRS